ncbi:MAG: DoxX family protein [Ferruginibacter sp.]
MKSLLSTKYSAGAFSAAMLLLRLVAGILLMTHGYDKLVHFDKTATFMPHLFGMSSSITAALVIFAEFFCSLFVILGLFTRLACVPIIICMCYALFITNHGDVLGKGELGTMYLAAFSVLLFVGPGRVSVDSMTGK